MVTSPLVGEKEPQAEHQMEVIKTRLPALVLARLLARAHPVAYWLLAPP